MADEDDTRTIKTPAAAGAPGAPTKLGRRDLLMGLSTVPALGLFGYAWSRQQQYRRGREEAAAATPAAAAGLQDINVARCAGAQGRVLMEAMLRIPCALPRGVRHLDRNLRRVVNTLKRFKQNRTAARTTARCSTGERGRRGDRRDAGLLARAPRSTP